MDAIQIPTRYDEDLNKQQYDQLPADTHGIRQPSMEQLGQPGTSNSIDQVSLLPVSGAERSENQMAAGFEPLTQQQLGQPAEKSTADSRSTRTIIGENEISEAEWKQRESSRARDKAYKTKKKQKQKQMKSDLKKFKAENLLLRETLERKPKNTETENGYDIEANRGNACDRSGQNYRKLIAKPK
ncbi:hypothetical protein SLEP1_g40670 [Rubroshorea leprosula]|uniref:BZIP domain-containing protein n=1 Tax=Rubroshorea leprosula TaxID=152421 RepID=A0AAV5L512_9ROSI|nr:hypothetical protein SLEP1_g40670 [Rubroshorea leprosula]